MSGMNDLEHMNAHNICDIYMAKVDNINIIMSHYINEVIFKRKYDFVYRIAFAVHSNYFKLRIKDKAKQKISIIYRNNCLTGRGAHCYKITLYQNNKNRQDGYYVYNSCRNSITNTISKEIFNNYSDDRKAILKIFSKKESITILEKIYNYFQKLYRTDYIYNYEKCIIILAAAKYKKFQNIPYDIAKIITYYTLQ
jgi:hypothetical protein